MGEHKLYNLHPECKILILRTDPEDREKKRKLRDSIDMMLNIQAEINAN